jgi:dolichyl-phosphate beta-glucosyltransferase
MSQSPQSSPYLSVIIPAYNEEQRLGPTLQTVREYLDKQSYSWELLVVDDGSKDATIAVAREALKDLDESRARVLPQPRNMGKGAAIKRGMLEARGQYRLFSDADLSTPIEEVEILLAAVKEKGATVAIGSRALKESNIIVHQPWYREMMGRVFNLLVQMIVLGGIRDTQCGFKLFTADAARRIFPQQKLPGFSFDVEILAIARKEGFKIAEVPVRWINEPNTRVSALSDSARMFLDVIKIRFGR